MTKKAVLFSAASLFLGLFLGTLLVHLPFLNLDQSVNVIELGNLIFLIIVSFTVPYLISSTIENKRNEKDLLISEIDIFCSGLRCTADLVSERKNQTTTMEDLRRLNYDFKRAREFLTSIEEPLLNLKNPKVDACTEELGKNLQAYWELLTGNAGFGRLNTPIDAKLIWNQGTSYNRILATARKLKFSVNNC